MYTEGNYPGITHIIQNLKIGGLMDHKEEKMKDKKMWVFNYVLVTGYMRSALRLGERFSVEQVSLRIKIIRLAGNIR